MLLPFLVAFIYIPSAIGAIICLLVVHRIPGSRLAVLLRWRRGAAGRRLSGSVWSLLSRPEERPAHARAGSRRFSAGCGSPSSGCCRVGG